MPRRKKADAPNPWEERCMLLIGSLEEIRRVANRMPGGAIAKIREVCDRHLGPDQYPDRKPCP